MRIQNFYFISARCERKLIFISQVSRLFTWCLCWLLCLAYIRKFRIQCVYIGSSSEANFLPSASAYSLTWLSIYIAIVGNRYNTSTYWRSKEDHFLFLKNSFYWRIRSAAPVYHLKKTFLWNSMKNTRGSLMYIECIYLYVYINNEANKESISRVYPLESIF